MSTNAPEIRQQRDGAAYHFVNGEILDAGSLPPDGWRLTFALDPEAENPARAVILTVGNAQLTMRNFQLRLAVGDAEVRHPATLADGFFHDVELIAAKGRWQLTVRGRAPVVLEAETPAARAIFGAKDAPLRYRGLMKDIRMERFTGTIEPPPPPTPENLVTLEVPKGCPGSVPLEGEWEFFCTPKPFDPDAPLPDPSLYTAAMIVPGFWDDHRDLICETRSFDRSARTNPRYRPFTLPMGELTPDATSPFLVATGYYRKVFRFAPDTDVSGVTLELGPAVWGAAVYCNGKLAAYNPEYSAGTTVRLDALLNRDGINTLIVVVSNYERVFNDKPQENSQHIGLAVRGYQGMRAGINGYCRLRLTGTARLKDAFARFDGETLRCRAEVEGKASLVRWTLRSPEGETLKTAVGADAELDVKGLRRWSDTDPYLYELEISAEANSKLSDRKTLPCGLRQLAVSGQRILVNGKPTYFRGLTEHYFFPKTANAPYDREKYLRDIAVWKSLGFNFMRFHTWCPPEPYLDAADESGMFCQIEVPPHTDPAEWIRILTVLRRHPSAVIVCGGNEEDFTEERIAEVRELAALTKKLCPGMLFNPQEALAKVEYRLLPDAPGVTTEPFIHDPKKLAELAAFSDVYGSYGWGYFSYIHTNFPGPETIDRRCAALGKPLLSHEIGILGGWLDFANEANYRDTVVPPEVYSESRKYLERCGVFSRAREFYELNCAAINRQRKSLLENIRRCRNITGYDYLGAFDAHWHRCGYPCGVLDEFNKPKPGIVPDEFRKINGPTVLLCDAECDRAVTEKSQFTREFFISHFGDAPLTGRLSWCIEAGDFHASGTLDLPAIPVGDVTPVGSVTVKLPAAETPCKLRLRAELDAPGTDAANEWEFWIIPDVTPADAPADVSVTDRLTPQLVAELAAGARILLTGNFPAPRTQEKFQCTTSGRTNGHCGTIIPRHPLLADLAPEGFADWQFFTMLNGATAMDFTRSPLPFHPLIEYIPSFKLVRRKTPLCEVTVGKGRLMMCGLRFESFDPAARYLRARILRYLASETLPDAPQASPETLLTLLDREFPDSGIVKTDEAWDPNVAGGKGKNSSTSVKK